jgi:hypothetical protein
MVVVGTGGIGTKIIKTVYPVEEGLEAGTQKQEGRQINLVPEDSSKVLSVDKTGIE